MWVGIKLVTMRCNRRNNEISHCYNLERIRCNSYKLFYATILLQHLIVVTILLHRINDVTIWIGCNSFVKCCKNVKFKYLLLQSPRNIVTQISLGFQKGFIINTAQRCSNCSGGLWSNSIHTSCSFECSQLFSIAQTHSRSEAV